MLLLPRAARGVCVYKLSWPGHGRWREAGLGAWGRGGRVVGLRWICPPLLFLPCSTPMPMLDDASVVVTSYIYQQTLPYPSKRSRRPWKTAPAGQRRRQRGALSAESGKQATRKQQASVPTPLRARALWGLPTHLHDNFAFQLA